MKITAVPNGVIAVMLVPRPERSPGGILLPDNTHAHYSIGKVVLVGKEVEYQVGDHILFVDALAHRVDQSTGPAYVMRAKDVIAAVDLEE